jgi:O-antigen/teichoic acid export membrane protein
MYRADIIIKKYSCGLIGLYKKNIKYGESLLLLVSTLATIPLGVISNIILTNYLGANSYGNFMFIINLFCFAILVFDFGLFQGGNRALVLNKDVVKARQYYGVLLLGMVVLYVLMSITLMFYALIDPNLHNKGLYLLFVSILPFCWLFLLPRLFEGVLYADNKIKELSISRVITASGRLGLYLLAYKLFFNERQDRLVFALAMYLISNFIVFIYLLYKLRPNLLNSVTRMKEILSFTKGFGFHVYLGSLFGVGMSQLSYMLISYFSSSNTGVGYFSLALAFVSPLQLIPNNIAATYYKDFSVLKRIPLKLTIATILLSAVSTMMLFLLMQPFVVYFYGVEFIPVINLAYIAGSGMLFYGVADYFNRFLGANGKGVLLRNSAFVVGVVILISNVILIPRYAEKGAAIAYLISGCTYLVLMIVSYRSSIKIRF